MSRLREVTFFLFFLSFGISTYAEDETPAYPFIPTDYELYINTTEAAFMDSKLVDESGALDFEGIVRIILSKSNPNGDERTITLNIDNKTKIIDVNLRADNNNVTIQHTTNNNTLQVKIQESIAKAKTLSLSVKFKNPFGDDMTGFYRSSYTTKDSKKRWLLTTHFEPIFARKAFPCFDVPHIKANFNITINVPKSKVNEGYFVLCNTPVQTKIESDDKTNVHFKCKQTKTPLSSYLVAFTVSDFKATEPVKFKSTYENKEFGDERNITTYGRKEIIEAGDGKLSQNAAKEAVTKLTEYLEIGYAYEKIDQIGIPDFSAGAMENWGHISFREKSLFINDKNSTTATKQSNVLTITHELVHQWFGNLVTLESWDYIWLNEAFATYLGYLIAARVTNPDTKDWDYMSQFLVDETHFRAFETDGLNSSKPLSNKILDESLIFSSFNDIPYSKGASVVRMWDLSLENDLFRKSLNKYLDNRKEKEAKPEDLMKALKEVGKMEESFFKLWTEKPGYPVVSVSKINSTHFKLTQKRFLWEKSDKEDNTTWTIPITFATDKSKMSDTKPKLWLKGKSIEIPAQGNWIIFNNKQAGYYRVNYEQANWNALANALKANFCVIHELNRAQIVNDVFSLARSVQENYVDYKVAMDLSKYLRKETSFIVWKTALQIFDFLQAKIYNDNEYYEKFKDHVLDLLRDHFKGLECKDKKHLEKLMIVLISRWACALGYEPCIKKAVEMYQSSSFCPDTQEIILCTVVRTNQTAWKEVFNKYRKEEDSSKKVMYLSVLGCTNNKTQAEEFLNLTLKADSGIRKQDQMFVLSSVYNGNLKNVEVAFKFVRNNFEKIAEDFGGINPLGRAVMGIAKKLQSEDDFKLMNELAEKIKKSEKTKAARDSIVTALGIIKSNKKWMGEREKQFKSSLKSSASFLTYSLGIISLSSLLIFQF